MSTRYKRYLKSYSWPRSLVRKWLNFKGQDLEFHDECNSREAREGHQGRKSCSAKDDAFFIPRDLSGVEWLVNSSETLRPDPPPHSLRLFVGTWNVGGRAPDDEELNLRDWLASSSSSRADIYVLGFQEIVPLNAGNVLGSEDRGPAGRWLFLIRQELNRHRTRLDAAGNYAGATGIRRLRASFSNPVSMMEFAKEEAAAGSAAPLFGEELGSLGSRDSYRLVASKQMVGIFLCVWVRASLLRHVSSVRASCVGRGIMGFMGNKGSISISMALRGTTFCFVCTHLASGEKEGDEMRRNSDVMEILRRTRFNQLHSLFSDSPDTILEHDKTVWLGDLNYRLAASWDEMLHLLQKKDWKALLEKDQLRREQRAGRVLAGWEEGNIDFPPTYKYAVNSDDYAVRTAKSGVKSRIPAWCDRILWTGKGMKQQCYLRGESRFSDHRPVYAVFDVELDSDSAPARSSAAADGSSSAAWGKVQAEEMLPLTRAAQSCVHAADGRGGTKEAED